MFRKPIVLTVTLLSGLAIIFAALPAFAQGPDQQPGNPPLQIAPVLGLVCSTTDYTEVAAKALGMTAAELRVALVSGKTLQDLATSKNVQMQAVADALNTARQADFEQAVKDGLIPQALVDRMGQRGNQPGGQQDSTQPATPSAPSAGQRPGVRIVAFGPRGYGISPRNVARPYIAAAQSIGISCPDLLKAMSGGKSIVQVATEKNVQVQTVVDAVVKAYKDALAQDVKEGLITQAQADGQSVRLVERVTAMISSRGPAGGIIGRAFRRFFGGGQQGSPGNRPDRPGNRPGGPGNQPGGDPGNKPDQPPATPQAAPTQAS